MSVDNYKIAEVVNVLTREYRENESKLETVILEDAFTIIVRGCYEELYNILKVDFVKENESLEVNIQREKSRIEAELANRKAEIEEELSAKNLQLAEIEDANNRLYKEYITTNKLLHKTVSAFIDKVINEY